MCWSFNFGIPGSGKNRKSLSSSADEKKKRRDRPADSALRGEGRPVAAATEYSEKRSSKESSGSKDASRKRRSADATSTFSPSTPRSPRRERESDEHQHRPRSKHYHHEDVYHDRSTRRPLAPLVDDDATPRVYRRSAHEPITPNSSQEALLNPRPHRSQHRRRQHPKQTSQSTLRGRGAKRDPVHHSKSRKNVRPEPSSRGWSLFAPSSPPKTPKREYRGSSYQTLDSSPRSTRSSRQHRSSTTSSAVQTSPESPRSHRRHSRHPNTSQPSPSSSSRQTRSRTPNTTARRIPDRRFAVLAATNQALEEVRQEAFAPSPPPGLPPARRERLRRYEGVTIPTREIPFNWDCVSSSQTSGGQGQGQGRGSGEASGRRRRSRTERS
ncbi:hypothetical protein G6011_06740 [Alternaria panax]|uniref:Uncharacterized protein n=1 Tax=Alternaria panax TaxID=48097 RepID=A0AAD4FHE3_9PLEO|nr:hypothetical protein G6011_06740 [Alternaria panax]